MVTKSACFESFVVLSLVFFVVNAFLIKKYTGNNDQQEEDHNHNQIVKQINKRVILTVQFI